VLDDAIDHRTVFDESGDTHLALVFGTGNFCRVISSMRLGKNLEETQKIR